MKRNAEPNAEQRRLEAQRAGGENWRLWGPYLAERAWGTVREDYSAHGEAWEHLDHDQARSRAYRWNEDGMGGICDAEQRLCLALALWNGSDPILKERAFGLTGNQGNHGEDVKEQYFYLDATPSHSFLRYLYKYPQAAYPYGRLVEENARRSRSDPPYSLLDTGVFAENRYWDVEVCYAKAGPDEIHVRIIATNRGPEAATLHLLPTLWYRNTWSWGQQVEKPVLRRIDAPDGAQWAVCAEHPALGKYCLYGQERAELLFTENETNFDRLWGAPNPSPYVKDAFHRLIVGGEAGAVNPDQMGTKFAAHYALSAEPGDSVEIGLTLTAREPSRLSESGEGIFSQRESEAATFHRGLLPGISADDLNILRQSLAGMIWNKQFYHFDVARWQDGDVLPPPPGRRLGRNRGWRHFQAADVISMPDTWEYPWFAAWDLAFHCAALALVDVDFAKDQIELLLNEDYLHANGQVPAYEWAFGDVNPPVLATGALKVFRAERVQRGIADHDFLQRLFLKLLLNYTWWINRKDADNHNLFEGGFMGLDNISVYDRSQPLPPGYSLKQADSTGWMAMFALNMTVMALELCSAKRDFEDIAIQCYLQFMAIANSAAGADSTCLSLWDEADGFFKDQVVTPDGSCKRVDVYSWVGIIPMFACEIVDERLLRRVPRFRQVLERHERGRYDGRKVSGCPVASNARGEQLLSLVDTDWLPRILARVLDEQQFLSPHGIRSVSRLHAEQRDLGTLPGIGRALIEYVPGESNSGLFGGNSNWRGPVWMPTNYMLVQAIEKYHRYLGDDFTIEVPCMQGARMNLKEIATLLSERLVNLFRRDTMGRVPAFAEDSPLQSDPHWRDLLLFNEYFHGETGQGLGASHQTGWTGLVANLVFRRYRTEIPAFWNEQRDVPASGNGRKLHNEEPRAAGAARAGKTGELR
ncbi:MAG: glucosidase [Betaproteobacteria bacterium]